MLGGLLTVIHSEVNERGMSSLQVRARHVLRYRRLNPTLPLDPNGVWRTLHDLLVTSPGVEEQDY